MPMKIGFDVTEVNGRLYDILPTVKRCVTAYGGEGNIIKSMSTGENGRFFVRRNVLIVDVMRRHKVLLVCRKLKEWLGPDYNIVKDRGLIKIKWDPKREKGNEK